MIRSIPDETATLLKCLRLRHCKDTCIRTHYKLEMHGKAQRVARPAQMCLQNSEYWTIVHQIFIRRRRVISGVNAHIHVAIHCGMPSHRMPVVDLCHFAPIGAKNRLPLHRPSWKKLNCSSYFARGSGCKVLWWARVCVSVCLSVCLSVREDISETTCAIFTKCFVHVAYGRGSVLQRRCDIVTYRRYVMYFRFCGWHHVSLLQWAV